MAEGAEFVATSHLTETDLRRELAEFKDRYPQLGDDELFVLWFLRAFVAEDEGAAVSALCGGPRDKGVDAVLIDDPARIVFVVQGKYRQKVGAKSEHRGDVAGFAQIAVDLCGDSPTFASFAKDLSPEVLGRLEEARTRVRKRSYALHMFYVTMGRCSSALHDEAGRIVRAADGTVTFQLFDGRRSFCCSRTTSTAWRRPCHRSTSKSNRAAASAPPACSTATTARRTSSPGSSP